MSCKKAPASVWKLCKGVIQEFHDNLAKSSIAIDILFKHAERDENDKPKACALRVQGRPSMGCIRITNLKERILKHGDAEMILDGDRWEKLTEPQQRALLDQIVTRLDPMMSENDEPEVDEANRPLLKSRKCDIHYEGFEEVAARHGDNSQELIEATTLKARHGKLLFNIQLEFDIVRGEAA